MWLAALLTALTAQTAPAHLVIVSTTDVHGRATTWDYTADQAFAGGLVRVATVVDSLRAQYPGQVIVLDAGDLIQGDPFAAYFARVAPGDTHPVVRAMNLIGYDAATPGNHEFNWGLETLRRALAGAAFPYVSANIRAERSVPPFPVSPFAVVRRSVRVGITGFTTPGVMVWDRAHVQGRLRVEPILPAARRALSRARRESDLSVVLIHSGMDGPASYDTAGVGDENVAAQLASLPDRPDLVIVGHSHREMRDSIINGVHFVQPRNWAQSVSVMHVDLERRGRRWVPVRWQGDIIPLDRVAPSPRLSAALAPAQDSVLAWVRQPLAEAAGSMSLALARTGPTPIIGFIHAVQRRHTGAQLSAASAFASRGGFRAGPIRLADVAGIYPYENTLRAIRLSGDQLRRFLEHSARYYRLDAAGNAAVNDSIPGYNFDMVAGAEYAIDLTRPLGERIVGLRVAGKPVAPTDSFTMAVNSYRQGGGGGYAMLAGAPVVYDRDQNIRDLLVAEVRERRRIDPRDYADSNWRILPAPAADRLRAAGRGVRLRILATSDLHGALEPRVHAWSHGRPVGGVVALKALMDSLEAACDCPTLRLDGGDQMQGTLISNLSYGRSTVAAMNALELDAAAIGNHELDWSPDTLRARMREARYAWLGANVFDSLTGRRPAWVRSHRIVETGGLRVGVIGYMTAETKRSVAARHTKGLIFPGGVAPIRDVLDSVRAARPDLAVIVAHAGAACDTVCAGEITDLARELPPGSVQAIVAGHTHRPVETVVNGIPIVQARSSGTALGVLDLPEAGTADTSMIALLDPWADGPVTDTALAALVAGYARSADSIAGRIVATLGDPLPKGTGEYPLGNVIADAQRAAGRADVAIMNNGGIRGTGLAAGPLTYGRLFELQPFGNNLVVLTVPGRAIRAAVEHALADGSPDAHVSGLRVRFDPSRPRGRRVLALTLADGRRVRDAGRYTLAVNDFMANGGSGYTMLRGYAQRTISSDIDALDAWLAARPQPVVAPRDRRFVKVSP